MIYFFGYVQVKGNATNFFDMGAMTDPRVKKTFNEFKAQNDGMI